MQDQRSLLFIILDGWGINSRHEGNAIYEALTPNLDALLTSYPSSAIGVSGLDVGLPEGQMGNSEVGHMHLGCGRVVFQDLTLIHRAIDDGSFFSNEQLIAGMKAVQSSGRRLHLMGLLGDGGVHSHQRHLEALIELARRQKVVEIFLHLFLDGRDTSPTAGEGFVRDLEEKLKAYPEAKIATLCGRYYAMDRDKRWDRTERAYRLLTEGAGETVTSAQEAIRKSYQDGKTDEFVLPTVINRSASQGTVKDGDGVIFFNFRADRARQLTRAFTQKDFKEFSRPCGIAFSSFVTMTEYESSFNLPAAFPSRRLVHTIGEIIADAGLSQLRIAETEKYAHVTYFFNGGEEKNFPNENRILIPSNKDVATYDLKPEMSAYDITGALLKEIASDQYGLILLNYANTDMVGHSGNFQATKRACEVVDQCVGKAVKAMLAVGGRVVITADHGNAEQMLDYDTGSVHTAHTMNYVPLILVDDRFKNRKLESGTAIDIAPTLLNLFGIPLPVEMTGHCLISNQQ